jgi:hypothetical protein
MGLVLTGKCFGRNSEGRPWRSDDGTRGGLSYKARVGIGGGEFLDVSVPEDLKDHVPTKADCGEDGMPVAWNLAFAYGKLRFESVAEVGSRALRPAASS